MRLKYLKSLFVLMLSLALLIEQFPQSLFASVWAEENTGESEIVEEVQTDLQQEETTQSEELQMEEEILVASDVTLVRNGSRLIVPDGLGTYVWQKSMNGTDFTDIPDQNLNYYDLRAEDSYSQIRLKIDGSVTNTVDIPKVIVFDIAKGHVKLGTVSDSDNIYSGINSAGESISGKHKTENVYIIQQSSNTKTTNSILFDGANVTFDVTLDGVNMGNTPSDCSTAANFCLTEGNRSDGDDSGYIKIDARSSMHKKVTLRLKGENVVRTIRYNNNNNNDSNFMKITSINGDDRHDGGKLYIPEKKETAEEINAFVESKLNYNHWNAGIGADDSANTSYNILIAGGFVQVLTTYSDNCTAIGAGGNGTGEVTITGGHVVAHTYGTGTAIGGGIGWNNSGGIATVTIEGENTIVYAENHGKYYVNTVRNADGTVKSTTVTDEKGDYNEIVGGVAIGCGSSFHDTASEGTKIYIKGNSHVTAKAAFGNGIGGGNSSSKSGGDAEIYISENATVHSSSIGGGNSLKNSGGPATVEVSGNAEVTLTEGIGGGTSTHGAGGKATVNISGSASLICGGTIGGGNGAYAVGYDTSSSTISSFIGGEATITVNGGELTAASIGGGDSQHGVGGKATITVNDGILKCDGVIGGGAGGYTPESVSGTKGSQVTNTNGGEATITVNGGTLNSRSIGGGTGSTKGHGGAAIIEINELDSSKKTIIRTGSIGGGSTLNITDGHLGYATAKITGGDIIGQFVMADAGETPCTFEMTGGTIHGVNLTIDSLDYDFFGQNGAALYIDDDNGTATISGGTIENCTAVNGGAVYMTAGTFELKKTNDTLYGQIDNCTAVNNGGAVYLGSIDGSSGTMTIDGGTIQNCDAVNGGAAYMVKGSLTVKSGTITKNEAKQGGGAAYLADGTLTVKAGNIDDNNATNGGAVYLGGGELLITGGSMSLNDASNSGGAAYVNGGNVNIHLNPTITNNTAQSHGGAIAVNDGDVVMTGGSVDSNTSVAGNGGGIYVSANTKDVNVEVRSGSVSNNKTLAGNGGALAVVGTNDTYKVNVTIGVNKQHFDGNRNPITCEHGVNSYPGVNDCPEIKNNIANASGGAIYVNGTESNTFLNLFCLIEEGSTAGADSNQSDFMKVDGGKVLFSGTKPDENKMNEIRQNPTFDNKQSQTIGWGNIYIDSSIFVTGGQLEVWGEMLNPNLTDYVTVNVQSAVHWYNDYRAKDLNDKWYSIQYYENFPDPATPGLKTGLYKAISVKHNTEQSLPNDLYVHPGYTIVGWTTDSDGKHTQNPSVEGSGGLGKYEVGKVYTFNGDPIGDIVIYAQWKLHGYHIRFDPNTDSFTGTHMPDQTLDYNAEVKLNKNTYSRIGYIFTGWNTEKDGSGTAYEDQQLVKQLAEGDGAVVYLYAQWSKCTHNVNEKTYTYTLIPDSQIRRDCECGDYFQVASITASDATYDQKYHTASVNIISSTEVIQTWNIDEISYSLIEDGAETDCGKPVNAGEYKASFTTGGKTAFVNYTIAKAVQPAPNQIPAYQEHVVDGVLDKLELKPVVVSPLTTSDVKDDDVPQKEPYDGILEYQLVYYESDKIYPTEWFEAKWTENGWVGVIDKSELNQSLTNYYIVVRYSECTNYLASETKSSEKYFNIGTATIRVIDGEGMTSTIGAAEGEGDELINGAFITIQVHDGYYLPDTFFENFEYDVEPNGLDKYSIEYVEGTNWTKYRVFKIENGTNLTITLPNALKKVTAEAFITEKQVFGKVSEQDDAIISSDSAFTAYFEVKNYYNLPSSASDYKGLKVDFNENLPLNTKIILVDKTAKEYFYTTVELMKNSVTLYREEDSYSDFVRMGTKNDKFVIPSYTTLQLQMIVDFSQVAKENRFADKFKLSMTLNGVKDDSSSAPDISASVNAICKDVASFALSARGDGLVKHFAYTTNESKGLASFWDNRDLALVLTPKTDLPADAHMVYTADGSTVSSIFNSQGKFIVPLNGPDSGEAQVTLMSNLFTEINKEYLFDVRLVAAYSEAEISPMNGWDVVEERKDVTFTANAEGIPSVKIESNVYYVDSSVQSSVSPFTAKVKYQDSQYCNLELTLMVKDANGHYVSTSIYDSYDNLQNAEGSVDYEKGLAGLANGSYCLRAVIMKGGINSAEIYHYFIIDSGQPIDDSTTQQ